MPVMAQPKVDVMLNRCVIVSATSSLSGTFLSVMTTAQSSPRMPIVVVVPVLMALKAYSKEPARRGETRQ
jgi:ABC-type Mn2+/Zn2+ transport system permease subunit